jgi:hypothetical protein
MECGGLNIQDGKWGMEYRGWNVEDGCRGWNVEDEMERVEGGGWKVTDAVTYLPESKSVLNQEKSITSCLP